MLELCRFTTAAAMASMYALKAHPALELIFLQDIIRQLVRLQVQIALLFMQTATFENTNNSYGALSDLKLKENIVDANSQWDDLKALQVRNYNFKEGQTHTQIGLVAQEVELVSLALSANPLTATMKATTLAPSPRASTIRCST
jgi:hypothetical protein